VKVGTACRDGRHGDQSAVDEVSRATFNERTYRNFIQTIQSLGVASLSSDANVSD
jgi:predicted NAD/FAD-binding protein